MSISNYTSAAQSVYEYLTVSLPHRCANTESERKAAEYIRSRFAEYTPEARIEDFDSLDTWHFLFGSYYAEFLVVSLLAIWFPWFALAYGAAVFCLYLAEFTGYNVMGRFLPQFHSQNVIARFAPAQSERLCIVTAHYDTPKNSPMLRIRAQGYARIANVVMVLSMVAVLLSCAAQALGAFEGFALPLTQIIRWGGLSLLLGGGAYLLYCDLNAEYTPAPPANAAGVAALVELARMCKDDAPGRTEVLLAATGSKEGGLNGMRDLLRRQEYDKAATYFVNLECPGEGPLCYSEGEGMLAFFKTPPELLKAAQRAAKETPAGPAKIRDWPTSALVPLARGFKAITVHGELRQQAYAVEDHRRYPLDEERTGEVLAAASYVRRLMDEMEDSG